MILRIYTEADLPKLLIWLGEAYEARRTIVATGRIASVSYEGKSVTYNHGSLDDLGAWIRDLDETIGWLQGRPVGRRPILGAF